MSKPKRAYRKLRPCSCYICRKRAGVTNPEERKKIENAKHPKVAAREKGEG